LDKFQSELNTFKDRVNKTGLYVNEYRKAMAFTKVAMNAPVSTVDLTTNAIIHAMTSFSPKSRYAVGMDSKAIRLAQNFLPDSVMDIGMKIFV
jgi:hypothetical protein